MCAAAFDSRWAGVAIAQAGPLYADSDVLQVVPNLLRYGDLPEIAALVAPGPLWLNGAQDRFGFSRESYRVNGRPDRVQCSDVTETAFVRDLPAWLEQTAKAIEPKPLRSPKQLSLSAD